MLRLNLGSIRWSASNICSAEHKSVFSKWYSIGLSPGRFEYLNFTAEELDYDRDKVKEHNEQYEYIQEILKDIENFKQQQAEEDLEM